MRDWTVGRRVVLGFGAVVALLALAESVSLVELARIKTLRNDSLPGLEFATRLQSDWLDSYSLTLRYLAASDTDTRAHLAPKLEAARADLDRAATQYESTVFQADERQHLYAYLRASFEELQDPLLSIARGRS